MPEILERPNFIAEMVSSHYDRRGREGGTLLAPDRAMQWRRSRFSSATALENVPKQFGFSSWLPSSAADYLRCFALVDPYEHAQHASSPAQIGAGNLMLIYSAPRHGTAFDLDADTEQETPFVAAIPSKLVASFLGRVESVGPASGVVSLVNEGSGESLEAQCDLEVLNDNLLRLGDEFRCEVLRTPGSTTARIVRLPPKALSKDQVAEVRRNFKDRWSF